MLDDNFSKGHISINLYYALISKELSEDEKAKFISETVEEIARKFPNLEKLSTKEIESTKSRFIKWLFGFWISQMLVFLGVAFFVFRALNI